MNRIFALIVLLSLAAEGCAAEPVTPVDVVRTAIRAVHQNDLLALLKSADLVAIATYPRHARTPDELVELFKQIDLNKLTLKVFQKEGGASVRINAPPLSIDIELKAVEAVAGAEPRYIIIAVHP